MQHTQLSNNELQLFVILICEMLELLGNKDSQTSAKLYNLEDVGTTICKVIFHQVCLMKVYINNENHARKFVNPQ